MRPRAFSPLFAALLAAGLVLAPRPAVAHCDTLDGPVVVEAQAALERGDVTPVLKWVRPEAEGEIREAFARNQKVRALSPEARALADRYFLETLVRVHREGEGAPYTGLKPAGEIPPGIALADKALESGSAETLQKTLADHLAAGLRARFERAAEARRHAGESVEKGREYVEAYVEFIHYAEGLVEAIHGTAAHPGGGDTPAPKSAACGHKSP